jgi:hypothetical protein
MERESGAPKGIPRTGLVKLIDTDKTTPAEKLDFSFAIAKRLGVRID